MLPHFTARRLENTRKLMRTLYGQPIISVKRAAEIIDGTENTAATLIKELVARGVLSEITGRQRDRLFAFQDYIALFRK